MIQLATLMQWKLQNLLDAIREREEGQDMIEYSLLAALISIAAIAVIVLVGPYIVNTFQDVVDAFKDVP